MNFYFQPVSWAAVRDVPVTYLKNARDRPVPPALQDEMIGRLPNPVTVIELDAGHIPAVTQPAAFAAILEDIAATQSGPRHDRSLLGSVRHRHRPRAVRDLAAHA